MSDLGSSNYSETAASNNASPPNGWPEGMNPSDVNNAARENMAGTKRFWNRANSVKTTDAGGTSTAYTLTYDVAEAAYYTGQEFSFVVDKTCGATPSLNINGLGAQNLRKFSGGAYVTLAAGDIVATQPVRVRNSGTTFDIIAAAADFGVFVPTGSVFPMPAHRPPPAICCASVKQLAGPGPPPPSSPSAVRPMARAMARPRSTSRIYEATSLPAKTIWAAAQRVGFPAARCSAPLSAPKRPTPLVLT